MNILFLVLVAGAIAYIGNYVGWYFGKKRLSLFGLRPRYTAMFFTIVSGVLIAILTFLSIMAISNDARQAFFGLESLRSEISSSQKELSKRAEELKKVQESLEKSKKEIMQLNKAKEELKGEMEFSSSAKVLFMAGEDVYITKLKGGAGAQKIEDSFLKILDNLDSEMKKYRIKEIQVDKKNFNSTIKLLENDEAEFVLRLISLKNTTVGGVLPIRLEVQENKLLFKKGDEIANTEISPKLSQPEVEQSIKDLLTKAHYIGKERGVLPDVNNSVGNIPYDEIYSAAKKVRGMSSLPTVKIISLKDIYTIGPMQVTIEVSR